MAGYDWIAADVKDGYAVMQSCGVTSGPWPGYEMPQFDGTDNDWYEQNIDGMNISDYDDKMSALYEAIKIAAKDHSSFGADNGCAWLGTVNSGDAWCAD